MTLLDGELVRANAALLAMLRRHGTLSMTDRSGRIIDASHGFCRQSGYSRDELIGQTHRILRSDVQDANYWDGLWYTIHCGDVWRGEICNQAKDGSFYWVDCTIMPINRGESDEQYIAVYSDITAMKLRHPAADPLEISLHNERVLMNSLLETLPDQIAFKDRDGRFLRINPTLARRHGLNHPSEAVGRSDEDYLLAADALRSAAMDRQVVETGIPIVDKEEQEFWPGRLPSWHLITKSPIRNPDGRIIGTVGVSHDITLHKQIKAQLQQTTERLAITSESAGVGGWDFEGAENRFIWDDRMYAIYGTQRSAGVDPFELWLSALHPGDKPRCESEFMSALRGETEFNLEFRIVKPSGEVRYLRSAARTVRNDDGMVRQMTGITLDITEGKRAELALVETSSLLGTVLDSAKEVSIIATDLHHTINVFNAGANLLLGYAGHEVLGRATPMLIHDPAEVHVHASRLDQPLEGWEVFTHPTMLNRPLETTYICKDGRRITVSLVVAAMHTINGELLGYLSVAHDVTQQRRYEESLRDATHKAEQASRAKSQFLANMSHEIRTPMNAVTGLSYLLGQTKLDPQQAAYLGHINHASKTLLAVINDVLDLSKIEAGELIIERSAFNLRELLHELAEVVAIEAHAKQIGFAVTVDDGVPTMLDGDAKHLRQILSNLLSNAVRFTQEGGVELCVCRIGAPGSQIMLRFSVEDTGIGIDGEAQTRLFKPFSQADASITRRFGGTGLGLSIVKSLTTLSGGKVSLQSTPGIGSVFTVELPFAPVSVEAEPAAAAEPQSPGERALTGVCVLLVDDSDINLEVTKRILEIHGARVSLASNGLEALERLQAKPAGYDVVLMDVQMPVLDGHAATRRIRVDLGLKALPIIALTAGALSSERQDGVAAGMDDFIIKPFGAKTLAACILDNLKSKGPLPAARKPGAARACPGPGISWFEINGIDSADARRRLNGDALLFRSSLRRMLEEFQDIAIPAEPTDPCAPQFHAGRMHKLKGIAGMLGAKTIQELAADAESACLSRDFVEAARVSSALNVRLQQLRRDSTITLSEEPPPDDRDQDDPLPTSRLEHLSKLLRDQNLAALDEFKAISPQLQALLGRHGHATMRNHVEDLRFKDAAEVLAASLAPREPAG